MKGGRSLPVLLLVAFALVTWDEVKVQGHLPPYPQRYLGGAVAFGLLGLLDVYAAPLAAALGFGVVLALAYKAVSNAGSSTASSSTDTTTTAPAGQVVTPINGEGFTSAPPVPGSPGGNLAGGPGVR